MSWNEIRAQVIQRDMNLCQSCFDKGENVHHVIPRRLGGSNSLDNLMLVCDKCHGVVELNRSKYGQHLTRFSLSFPDWLAEEIDKARGDIPRSTFIMKAAEAILT